MTKGMMVSHRWSGQMETAWDESDLWLLALPKTGEGILEVQFQEEVVGLHVVEVQMGSSLGSTRGTIPELKKKEPMTCLLACLAARHH